VDYGAGFTRYTSQQMIEGRRPMMITTTKNAHHQRSIDVISVARPRENPRFAIGFSADRKKWKKAVHTDLTSLLRPAITCARCRGSVISTAVTGERRLRAEVRQNALP
jgi:hypothetical protein